MCESERLVVTFRVDKDKVRNSGPNLPSYASAYIFSNLTLRKKVLQFSLSTGRRKSWAFAWVSYQCCNKLLQTCLLQTTWCIILQFWRSEIWNGSHRLKSRYWQGSFLSRGSRGKPVSLFFATSRGDHLHSWTLGPLSPSPKPVMLHLFLFSVVCVFLCCFCSLLYF